MFLIHLRTTHQNIVLKELDSSPTGAEQVSDLAEGSPFPGQGCAPPAPVKSEPPHFPQSALNSIFLGGTERTRRLLSLRSAVCTAAQAPACWSPDSVERTNRKSHSLHGSSQTGRTRRLLGGAIYVYFPTWLLLKSRSRQEPCKNHSPTFAWAARSSSTSSKAPHYGHTCC